MTPKAYFRPPVSDLLPIWLASTVVYVLGFVSSTMPLALGSSSPQPVLQFLETTEPPKFSKELLLQPLGPRLSRLQSKEPATDRRIGW